MPEFWLTNHYFIKGKRYFWQYYLQLSIFKEILPYGFPKQK